MNNQAVKAHIYACTFDCMDARSQQAVAEGTKKVFHADMVDVITQAGMVKVLADNKDQALINDFKYELKISVEKHGAKNVSIAAHADCAGNPVSKEQQLEDLKAAKKTVEGFGLGVKVVLLWVDEGWDKAEVVE